MINLQLTENLLDTKCDPVDYDNFPYDPVELSNAMTLFREEKKGVGLAANQVGIPYRVVSVKGIDSCMFNPKVVYEEPHFMVMEEGCLSFPGLSVKIKRPTMIRVRWTDAFGRTTTDKFVDLTARVILHEIDHLDGIRFYNRANKFHRDQAFRKWKR